MIKRIILVHLILLLTSVAQNSYGAVRGPYLQNATTTSVTVHWRSSSSYTGMVRYGTSLATIDNDVIEGGSSTNDHIVTVSGLLPDTLYYYRIGNSAGVVLETPPDQSNQYFRSNPGAPRATRIWALGDSGSGTGNQGNVRDAYYALSASENKATDVVLALGDNAYNNGTDSEYGNNFFDVYQEQFRKTPVWSTQGNHERNYDVYADVFSHPVSGEGGGVPSGSELYYSFDFGDIHFVCLDSYGSAIDNTAGAPQFQWLELDLAATTKKWIIAFWHHPPFSYTTTHNADVESGQRRMRENAVEFLEDAGVDVVLGGHNHHYDRTQFINGHYGQSSTFSQPTHVVQTGDGDASPYSKGDNRGASYVMTGSAGKNNTYTIIDKPVTQVAFDRLGSFIIETNADNTELTMRMLRDSGSVDDTFRIVKLSNVAPVVSAGTGGTVQIPDSFTLDGSVIDDDFTGNPLTVTWSQIAGPTAGASFADVNSPSTTVTFSQAGTYTLRLTADDGEFDPFDDTTVTAQFDSDADGIDDSVDNCLLAANLAQRDTDGDSIGNLCDPDFNNDCAVNFLDLDVFAAAFLSTDVDTDINGDGTVNFIDLAIAIPYFFGPPGPSGLANICSD